MNKIGKVSGFVFLVALAIIATAVTPLVGSVAQTSNEAAFGPDCCRYDNECPGTQTCGDTTGCSAGAPYQCKGSATELEQ